MLYLPSLINKEIWSQETCGAITLGVANLQQRNPDFFNVASEREGLRAERKPREESQVLFLVHSFNPLASATPHLIVLSLHFPFLVFLAVSEFSTATDFRVVFFSTATNVRRVPGQNTLRVSLSRCLTSGLCCFCDFQLH
jgi:hypothetical protein